MSSKTKKESILSKYNKKHLIMMVALFIVLSSVIYLAGNGSSRRQEQFFLGNPVQIVGDTIKTITIDSLEGPFEATTIDHKETLIDVIPLQEIILAAQPITNEFEVLYMAHDGFSALIPGDNLGESYLTWTEPNGWEVINKNHPVSSNVKGLSEIAVISRDTSLEHGLNIIERGRNIVSLTPGKIFKNGYYIYPAERGTASLNLDSEELWATSFNRLRVFNLDEYMDLSEEDNVLVVGKKGEVKKLSREGLFILSNNRIDYMEDDEIIIQGVRGIVVDPPDKRITDVYHDVKTILDDGEKVLVIIIDGFGYHQYEYAKKNGYIPFLASLPAPEKAMVSYPPVTPVNIAASLTGELPPVNGVYRRGIRRTDVPTIFQYCKDNGKKSMAVLGDMTTIELEISPILSLDENNDGSTDDEKTKNALKFIGDELDLLFVHYKDVDINGHNYGDLAPKTLESMTKIDGYVNELVSNWNDKVLIYSDHGMHKTDLGGHHGIFRAEDMFIPYWLFDGGGGND